MYLALKKYINERTEIDSNTLDEICLHFRLIKTKRNEVLLHYDQVCKHYYFINKGSVRLYTTSNEELDMTRYFAFEGSFVTALPSFIDQLPAGEFLQTLEKSELLCISRTDFYALVNKLPQFAKIYTEILEQGFVVAQKRIYGFQGFDAFDKVKWVINNQPRILLQVSNKMAASYLGITPSTLSRIKSKL